MDKGGINMKKYFMVLVIALVIFAVTPVFANEGGASAEETALFLSLLTDEARAAMEEVGEGFAEELFQFAFMELAFDDGAIEELAEWINSSPQLIWTLSEIMAVLGYWGDGSENDFSFNFNEPPQRHSLELRERAAAFSHGTYFYIEDVVAVLEASAEFNLERLDVDFFAIVDAAGFTRDQIAGMFFGVFSHEEISRWYLADYGEQWLFFAVDEFVSDIIYDYRMDGMDNAVMYLRMLWTHAETIRILGFDAAGNFVENTIFELEWIFDYQIFDEIIAENVNFIATIERLVEHYGIDGFAEVFRFNLNVELEKFIRGEDYARGIDYLDEMLNGLLTNNLQFLQDDLMYEFYYDELIRLTDLIEEYEETELFPSDLERKFVFEINQEMSHVIEISNPRERLNIFYENTSDETATLVYFVYNEADDSFSMRTVEVAAGGRFTTQLNFENSPARSHIYFEIFIMSPDGATPDGTFAFRMTEFELGHPSHR
jgi:hypothetical protein